MIEAVRWLSEHTAVMSGRLDRDTHSMPKPKGYGADFQPCKNNRLIALQIKAKNKGMKISYCRVSFAASA
jgi:hypothetical protein